jgi:hypothetical protein
MKSITVYPQDIIPNAKYMCDAEGRCDLLGQLLINGYGIRIPPKTRTPQCLQSAINNFVVCIRSYVYSNTPLTIALLKLTSLPPRKQIAEANKLLQAVGIVLVTEDQQESIRSNIQQPTTPVLDELVEPQLILTNLFRTSRYRCDCGGNQVLTSLVIDDNNLYCTYCQDEVPTDVYNQIKNKFQEEITL